MDNCFTQFTQDNISTGNNQPAQKKDYRSRKWIFTFNNYTENQVTTIKEFLCKNAKKWIFGYEIAPTTGTPHLQGYMEFKNTMTWSSLNKKGFTCWGTAARGSLKDNYDYTTKDCKFEHGGINIEKLKWKVKINKFYPWESIILNILKEPADDRTFYWIWEPNGCAGKTTFQKYIFQNFENVVVLSGKSTDMKNGIIQFIEKNNETPDIVLINIPRSNIDFVSYEGLECIKDMFFFSGKYEGGMVCGKPPHLFIFANEKPPDDKLSSDRLKVFKI